jgi:branched-chain amino acid aminotransferase group I
VTEIVYLNGQLIPRAEARLSPFDHGFLYGYGLFETMRAYDGRIFRLDRHLARLRASARILGLADNVLALLNRADGRESLESACVATLEANRLTNARLRLTISPGEGDPTPEAASFTGPTVLVTAQPLVPLPQERYEQGFRATLASLRRNSQSPLSRLKATCYLESILARREARAAGYDEAMLLNEKGYLAEGSMSNVFVVNQGELITPWLDSGVLPGVTREAVLEIASTSGIRTTEREVQLQELTEAGEAFVTNSVLEIMPLTWFEDKPIGTGWIGRLAGELLLAYRKLTTEPSPKGVSL